ncbi:MAG TPA: HEAT repeat domain-containing protein [Gemmatimonadaceae bacterium]|nr:HEAT repeat domain-containing protein [Gemmatimonadaceae bacterium]
MGVERVTGVDRIDGGAWRIIAGAILLVLTASALGAQSIARRVERVRDGTVRMSFASRPDVCGNGRGNISTSSRGSWGTRYSEWEDECEHGPVRVAMDVAAGHIIAVRTYVGGRWKGVGDAVDLGLVGDAEAVDFLLDNAARGSGSGAREAIFPASIADSVVVWPRLLAIAKDDSRERGVRTQAVFWVSQAAGEKASEGLAQLAGDAAEDRDVRLQAVFAISQRHAEGVATLINIARTSKDPEIRKQAIFWLGQSRDPRAIEFFEAILTRK